MAHLLVPSGVAYLLAVLGVLAFLWRRSRRHSAWLFGASALTMLVFSSSAVATALIAPLEYAYPAVHSAAGHPEVRTIVVLTAYAADDPDMPLTGRLNGASAHRITMTMQLKNTCPGCRVIVSGSNPTAKVMGEVLVELGLARADLVLEDQSPTTSHSAANLVRVVAGEKFFLVTSAGHMTRSLGVMRKAGLNALPVPTDYAGPKDWWTADLGPSTTGLMTSDLALHEYVGLAWYRLRGWI